MTGILLVNLGTPKAPTARAVRPYLRQFLSDPLVIDIPALWRWLLVNLIIVPFRSPKSAAAYQKIWKNGGSPLMINSQALADGVQKNLGSGYAVVLAMRYGSPSIANGLKELISKGVREIRVLPLYPQYSLASTESVFKEVRRIMKKRGDTVPVKELPAFCDDSGFVGSVAACGRDLLGQMKPDHILFSFHGLPERQVRATDHSGGHCLVASDCCSRDVPENKNCYARQCHKTADAVAEHLGLRSEQYSVSYQSRLGRTPWLKPYTDHLFMELPKKGLKRILVFSPAFVADCLETLEELQMRGREQFLQAGGEEMQVVPCPNSRPEWVKAVCNLVR